MPTQEQIKTVVRYLFAALGGAVTLFSTLHIISAGDAQNAINALNTISDSVAKITAAVGALVTVIVTVIGFLRSNPLTQLLNASKSIADKPELAAQISKQTDEAKVAVAQAAVTVANNSETVNRALLEKATEQLPNVQGVVVDERTSLATNNPNVTSNPTDIPKAA